MSSIARRSAGFTLIELLVVLALVGLLAGLTLPLVRGSGSDPLDEAARSLGRTLEARRLEAMREGEAVTLVLEEVKGELAADIVVEAPNPKAGLVFLPNGRSSGGRWTLSHDGRSRTIEVDWLTGRVRADDAD